MNTTSPPVGALLRQWRERRRMSQLDLSIGAEVSTRHLSYIETGRSTPTSTMIERLAEYLEVPLRDRNTLLLAGGFAPGYLESRLSAPPMAAISMAIRQILSAHLPYPALVIDGHWDMVDANDAVAMLTDGLPPRLMEPPVNMLRLSLHPDGLASRIVNLGEWRGHLLDRLDRQISTTADPALESLREELTAYPGVGSVLGGGDSVPSAGPAIIVPLRIRTAGGVLNLFSTTTVFGTPRDVTVAELAIESFYPADPGTGDLLRNSLVH